MLCYFTKGESAIEMQKKMYGEDTVTDWTCQKWFVKFWAGDVSLEDVPQSERPVEADSK